MFKTKPMRNCPLGKALMLVTKSLIEPSVLWLLTYKLNYASLAVSKKTHRLVDNSVECESSETGVQIPVVVLTSFGKTLIKYFYTQLR